MSKKTPTGRERRSLRNLVQNPRVQYRYALYFFGFAVAAPLQALALRMTILYPIFGMVCAAFAIWVTHKFVGPQVALRRHIGQLQSGDYTAVCRLRAGDELQPGAAALNELARELESQQGAEEERKAA
jgi:signal transduction histidine kinase